MKSTNNHYLEFFMQLTNSDSMANLHLLSSRTQPVISNIILVPSPLANLITVFFSLGLCSLCNMWLQLLGFSCFGVKMVKIKHADILQQLQYMLQPNPKSKRQTVS